MSETTLHGLGTAAWVILGTALIIALGFIGYFLWTLLASNRKRRREEATEPTQTASQTDSETAVRKEEGVSGRVGRVPRVQSGPTSGGYGAERHDAGRLLLELLKDLGQLVDKYSALATNTVTIAGPGPVHSLLSDAEQASLHNAKALNDVALIHWWEMHGGESIEACKASLAAEFGDIVVELVSVGNAQGDWQILAVRKNGDHYYILPRKTGWVAEVFDGWFRLLEQGSVRGNELIRAIRSPLARAVKAGDIWRLVGRKGVISVNSQ